VKVKLAEIAEIRAGHAFRSAITPDPMAGCRVIQIRDLDPDKGVLWSGLESCTPPGRKSPMWVREGDLLLQARGRKNFAVCLGQVPYEQVVCTQHFFIVRVHDQRFTPAFIEWQLNQEVAQRHFDMNTEDTNTRHITLATLGTTPVMLADQATQKMIHQLVTLAREEQLLFEGLMDIRQQQMAAIATQVLRAGETV